MLKLLGSCMILTGCFGIGWWYRAQFNGRLGTIRTLRGILELLSGEVRYGRSTLPECCSLVAGSFDEPFGSVLERIGQKMRDNIGLPFGEVFQKEFEEALDGTHLKSEDSLQGRTVTRMARCSFAPWNRAWSFFARLRLRLRERMPKSAGWQWGSGPWAGCFSY